MGLSKIESTRIKGIAILLMFMHHLYMDPARFDGYTVSFFPFTQEQVIDFAIACKICVSIFAFISGYGLACSYQKVFSECQGDGRETAKWVVTRVSKLLLGFLFVYFLTFFATMLIDGRPIAIYFDGSNTAGLIYMLIDMLGLANMFGTPSLIGTWWYMTAAIVYICCVPIVYSAAKKFGWLSTLFLLFMIPRLLGLGYLGGINSLMFLPPMCLGMVCFDLKVFERLDAVFKVNVDDPSSRRSIIIAAITALALVVCYRIYLNIVPWDMWELEYGIFPVIFIIFVRYAIISLPIVSNILTVLGRHSMTMFLTHSFIRGVYCDDIVYSNGNFMANFIVLLVLSLFVAIGIDKLKDLVRYHQVIDRANKLIASRYA